MESPFLRPANVLQPVDEWIQIFNELAVGSPYEAGTEAEDLVLIVSFAGNEDQASTNARLDAVVDLIAAQTHSLKKCVRRNFIPPMLRTGGPDTSPKIVSANFCAETFALVLGGRSYDRRARRRPLFVLMGV